MLSRSVNVLEALLALLRSQIDEVVPLRISLNPRIAFERRAQLRGSCFQEFALQASRISAICAWQPQTSRFCVAISPSCARCAVYSLAGCRC